MKRTMFAALALVFALGLMPQVARAQDNNWNTFWTWLSHGQDPRLIGVWRRRRPWYGRPLS